MASLDQQILSDVAQSTLERARELLLSLQSDGGWWKGELETNVTMDAEDLMLRQFLGVRTDEATEESARWIRSQQCDDGSWANFYGGPGDLSTTIEAYVGLRLAGDEIYQPHMQRAAAFVREAGGLENARVFTHIWLALFGFWSWHDLPAIPPEAVLLPPSIPLNIYDFGCWARQTLVALTVVASYRPVRPLDFGVEELRSGVAVPAPKKTLRNWSGRFQILDSWLWRYERIAERGIVRRTLRELALSRAERWIVRRQEADGSWGGIQPPWVYSILALHLRGYPLNHPVMEAALVGLDQFTIRRDGMRFLEACQSPVWDTALAVIALADAGVAPDSPALIAAAQWLLGEEVRSRGDWAVRRPDLPEGGWAFEFANDNYPDVDDTAEVVLALRRVTGLDPPSLEAAVDRALSWSVGMTSSEGAWGAFDVDNQRDLLYELPFCDFGAVIDPPSADVTAHMVEMLASESDAPREVIERGLAWLRAQQEDDGSWFGRWGVNYVYGIGAVVPALVAGGVARSDPAIQDALEFLFSHQNPDGGWGEDIRSYDDQSLAGVGASTASQTAWALLALIAAGEADHEAAHRGVAFLVTTQREDGNWDEPYFTGTGFPGDFYLNYHLYRLVFPVSALGRWLQETKYGVTS
jgi:squalene-hopene/tetraprenyl-beta-curcumene cyclase